MQGWGGGPVDRHTILHNSDQRYSRKKLAGLISQANGQNNVDHVHLIILINARSIRKILIRQRGH